jgi:competence protein ComEC
MRRWRVPLSIALVLGAIKACDRGVADRGAPPPATAERAAASDARDAKPIACGSGAKMVVRFYDVGQGLAAMVDLPDGRHVLVDAGDVATRSGCGDVCARAHTHLVERLSADLHGAPLDLLWITHQHSDHMGGASDVLARFDVGLLVDNGRDDDKQEIVRLHDAARARGVRMRIVNPSNHEAPLASSLPRSGEGAAAAAGAADTGATAESSVRVKAVVPKVWPPSCSHDANDCSIGLRIDYCGSSVLFTGDAEADEEHAFGVDGERPISLLQVGHHGSDTSSSIGFLDKARPSYAVISAGHPGDGLNATYCHPRSVTVERLTERLGGAGQKTIRAFDGKASCKKAKPEHWHDVPASDRLWATERDGDVVLSTTGDGVFVRQ